jgi:hypothetical protein
LVRMLRCSTMAFSLEEQGRAHSGEL